MVSAAEVYKVPVALGGNASFKSNDTTLLNVIKGVDIWCDVMWDV
jgi:hypothetical protein